MKHFGEVLLALSEGKKVQRKGWNGRGLFITLLVNPTITDDIGDDFKTYLKIEPFYVIHNPIKDKPAAYRRNTWVPSSADLLAIDWEVLED